MENSTHLKYYQETGLRIGYIPSKNLKSTCVDRISGKGMSMDEIQEKCRNPGFLMEWTIRLMEVMRIPLERVTLFRVNHTVYGKVVNGTCVGLIGEIQDGLYDTSVPYISITDERKEVVDFSRTIISSRMGFLTR